MRKLTVTTLMIIGLLAVMIVSTGAASANEGRWDRFNRQVNASRQFQAAQNNNATFQVNNVSNEANVSVSQSARCDNSSVNVVRARRSGVAIDGPVQKCEQTLVQYVDVDIDQTNKDIDQRNRNETDQTNTQEQDNDQENEND